MEEQKKQDTNQLLKVRREKLADLQANGKDPFQITKFDQTHHSLEVKNLYEAHEAEILKDHKTPDVEGLDEAQAREVLKQDYEERRKIMDANPIHVAIAGRMMFKRVMGKASFCNIQDLQGNIQVYVARDAIGEESYADFKKSDIGDIFGLEGFAFRTRTGEISIHAEKMTTADKEFTDPSGEIPRTDRYRYPLSSEICRPYHESGQQRMYLSNVPRFSKRSVTSLQDVTSWKSRLQCWFPTPAVQLQDRLRHITMH